MRALTSLSRGHYFVCHTLSQGYCEDQMRKEVWKGHEHSRGLGSFDGDPMRLSGCVVNITYGSCSAVKDPSLASSC